MYLTDATIARFLQADPNVDGVTRVSGFNRYAYVGNNPLNATDPSGYFLKKLKKIGRKFIRSAVKIFGPEIVNFVGTAVFSWIAGPIGAAAWNYEFARSMGVSSSEALKGAAIAYVSAHAYSQIGNSGWTLPVKALAHGVVGGLTSVLQGGKFGHGFVSAGFTKLLNVNGMYGTQQGLGHTLARTGIAAIIGGTISEATGGKFANGARSAALGQLFNGEGEARRNPNQDGWFGAAQKRHRDRFVSRRVGVTTSVNEETGAHEYRIRGLICSTSSSGCNADLSDSVYGHVNANDIPFTDDDLRAGPHSLKAVPFLKGDPITHTQSLSTRTSVNIAEQGHRFYPGTVTHRVHFENGNLYYDLIGVGTGSNPGFNNFVGIRLFRPGVSSVVREYGF